MDTIMASYIFIANRYFTFIETDITKMLPEVKISYTAHKLLRKLDY